MNKKDQIEMTIRFALIIKAASEGVSCSDEYLLRMTIKEVMTQCKDANDRLNQMTSATQPASV